MADQLFPSRGIGERVIVEGTLVLETPTHFGNGDTEGLTDMPLLLDETDQSPLLPGTSIAGALRNYLRERLIGYQLTSDGQSMSLAEMVERLRPPAKERPLTDDERKARDREIAQVREMEQEIALLFGGVKGDDEGAQSALIVDDAQGDGTRVEMRDGVRIDPETRTAQYEEDVAGKQGRGYKFDLELLEAGTQFGLRFELLVPEGDGERLKQLLAAALDGLAQGDIGLGLRKRRGFGECRVPAWTVTRYELTQPAGLLAWLAEDHPDWRAVPERVTDTSVARALHVTPIETDARSTFTLDAEFALASSLLIRAGSSGQGRGPDVAHLTSKRPLDGHDQAVPIVSGTSLAGVLRGRALRIVRTLRGETEERQISQTTRDFMDVLFGPATITADSLGAFASRLAVKETVVEGRQPTDPVLVQNRIRLDRFTGGAYETALFNEQPLLATPETRIKVQLSVRAPRAAEVGLLCLLLKDLWLADLPLGGESSIGRGRLRGVKASLQWNGEAWTVEPSHRNEPRTPTVETGDHDQSLTLTGNWQRLETCVAALREELGA